MPSLKLTSVFLPTALAILLAGCSSGPTSAYIELQKNIKQEILKKEGRAVRSVACQPHVKEVAYSDGVVDLNCFVKLSDGESYTTPATIEARAFQVAGYNYTWDGPGPQDITKASLPRPTTSVSPTNKGSLFNSRNLKRVLGQLESHTGSGDLILKLALYPGELVAVVGAEGQARLVTAHSSGAITAGPQTSFEGERSGITISQLHADVPEHLARRIGARYGVPIGKLQRFELTYQSELVDWKIYTTEGQPAFQAHVLGDGLKRVSRSLP